MFEGMNLLAQGGLPIQPNPQDETAAAEQAIQALLQQAMQKTQMAQGQEQTALQALQGAQAQPAEQVSPLTASIGGALSRVGTAISGHDYSTEFQNKLAQTNKGSAQSRTENLKALRETYEQAAKSAREAGDHEAEIRSRTAIQKLDVAAKKDAAAARVTAERDAAEAKVAAEKELQGLKHQDKLKEITAQLKAKSKEPPSPKDLLQGVNTLTDNISKDSELKDYAVIRDQLTTGRDAVKANNSAGDIILMRAVARATDPRTGVREEEYRTFESAQGALAAKGVAITKGMLGKGKLNEFGRRALLARLEDLNKRKKFQAKRSYDRFKAQVEQFLPGVDPELVIQMYEPEEESGGSQDVSVTSATGPATLKFNPTSGTVEPK